MDADWTPHRRDDGELIGWTRPERDAWVAVDVLGREASGPVDWLEAEAALEDVGLRFLADVWMLEGEADAPTRVRIVEVTPPRPGAPGRIVVQTDDFGAIDAPVRRFELPAPSSPPASCWRCRAARASPTRRCPRGFRSRSCNCAPTSRRDRRRSRS